MGNAFAFRNLGWFCVLSHVRPQVPAPPVCLSARGWGICKEALDFLLDLSIPFPVQLQGCFAAWVEGPGTGVQKPWVDRGRTRPCRAVAHHLHGLRGLGGDKPLVCAILIPFSFSAAVELRQPSRLKTVSF